MIISTSINIGFGLSAVVPIWPCLFGDGQSGATASNPGYRKLLCISQLQALERNQLNFCAAI